MATRLEIAEKKLSRLEEELRIATNNAFDHMKSAHGSPTNDKRNGDLFLRRVDELEQKSVGLYAEIEEQKARIEKLKEKSKRDNSLAGRIKELEENIARHEEGDGFLTSATIRKNRKKLQELKEIEKEANKRLEILSDRQKSLLTSDHLTQWKKDPRYYFVNKHRKVALIINDTGEFEISNRFPTKNQSEESYIKNMLGE